MDLFCRLLLDFPFFFVGDFCQSISLLSLGGFPPPLDLMNVEDQNPGDEKLYHDGIFFFTKEVEIVYIRIL